MPSASFNRGLAVLVAATFFMENLDGTIIQTAAPVMARDFGVRAVDLNTAMTAYLLTVAVFIPVSGWLADRIGVRKVFFSAIVLFTVASVLCALAPSLGWLVAARVLQGIGGAMMVPVGRLAVLRAVEKRDLLDAMAYLTWPALLAPVIAPALGGILADTVGWHWIFLINVPIGAAVLVAGRFVMPAGVEAAGAAAGRSGYALLLDSLKALRIHTFRVGNVGGGVYRLMISAAPFLFTLLFQSGFGWSATKAGLLVIAVFVGNLAIKPATTPLIRRFGFRTVIAGSNAIGAAILLLVALVTAETPLAVVAVLLLFSGVFRSIGFSGYNTIQFVDVPPELANGANTLASFLQQLAAGLGVAVAAGLVQLGTLTAGASLGESRLGYSWAFVAAAALLVVPLVEALRMPRHAGAEATAR